MYNNIKNKEISKIKTHLLNYSSSNKDIYLDNILNYLQKIIINIEKNNSININQPAKALKEYTVIVELYLKVYKEYKKNQVTLTYKETIHILDMLENEMHRMQKSFKNFQMTEYRKVEETTFENMQKHFVDHLKNIPKP